MAGAVPKIFGILFLLIGISVLVAGIGAAVYGAMDEKDHQEGQGPFGVGRDADREKANESLVIGGLAGGAVGFLLVVIGIILLLVGGRDRHQQQQQILISSDADGNLVAQQQQEDAPRRRGLALGAVAGILLLVVLFVGFTGDAPLASSFYGAEAPKVLETDAHVGNIGPSGTAGPGYTIGGHEVEHVAPAGTEWLTVQYDWSKAAQGAGRLRLSVSVDTGNGFESVFETILVPGEKATVDGGMASNVDLGGLTFRFRIEPADVGIYEGQTFEGTIRWIG